MYIMINFKWLKVAIVSAMQRRDFMKLAGATGVLTVTPTGQVIASDENPGRGPPSNPPSHAPPRNGKSVFDLAEQIDNVRCGIVGLGGRGSLLAQHIDSMYPEKGEIRAICDIEKDAVQGMSSWFSNNSEQNPDEYYGNRNSYQELCERDDLDVVFNFTPWQIHAEISVYALEQGKHVGTEIPAAMTIEECWDLVMAAERNQKQCMMLENVNYFNEEMWVLNMVKQGVFGDELTYGMGGYIHDLIHAGVFFDDDVSWNYFRDRAMLNNTGNHYPTHGLGPIAHYMDILRGDRLEYIVSHDSPETRMTQAAADLPPDHEFAGETNWAAGDMNTSIIRTAKDKQITLQEDFVTGREYSRHNQISGNAAFHDGFPSTLTVDGEFRAEQEGDSGYDAYREEYNHPLWESLGDLAEQYGGHGGGDWLMIYRFFDAFNDGRPLDQNVYEAATWSAVVPLTQISIEHDNAPVRFPDFTRGEWEQDRELEVMK